MSEAVGNVSFMVKVKDEPDNPNEVFMEQNISICSVLKTEPEHTGLSESNSNSSLTLEKFCNFPLKQELDEVEDNSGIKNELEDMDKEILQGMKLKNEEEVGMMEDEEQFETRSTDSPLSEKKEGIFLTDIEENSETDYADVNLKNEEVDLKDEKDMDQDKARILANSIDQEKSEDYSLANGHQIDQTRQEQNLNNPVTNSLFLEMCLMFKCDQCQYQTPSKVFLNKHLFRHKNPKVVDWFKCDQCDYKTLQKMTLEKHILRHKRLNDANSVKCEQCSFRTLYRSNLRKHILQHKNPEDVNMYKCDQCDYQTLQKSTLNRHILRHKKPEDVEMFKCHHCNNLYQTRRKDSLNAHILRRHKDRHHVVMFNCDQ